MAFVWRFVLFWRFQERFCHCSTKSPFCVHTVCECLEDLQKKDIIKLGLSLGLYYPNLIKMEMFPHEMVHAWLLRSDNVVKKSGTPTSASLILALESLHLSATVDTVKSHFP